MEDAIEIQNWYLLQKKEIYIKIIKEKHLLIIRNVLI